MGYGAYFRDGRWAGYGVPAVCDKPGCGAEIDRGMAYLCGGEPGSSKGCGLFFCSSHLWIAATDDDPQMCERCCDGEPPFDPTPDTSEWVEHMLTDDSWEQWRKESPERVTAMREEYRNTPDKCHCGQSVVYGYDGDPTHHRGMCKDCDPVRCDAHPGACRNASDKQ